jgi:POT family proton-dependent oligopeptide transporter
MSAGMRLDGVPNDLLNNFNPLAIIVAAPILNFGLYPFMANMGRPLKPMTRMAIGFLLGCIGCVIAAVVQWRVYATSPCGYQASTCVETIGETSTVSLWWQLPIYFIPAVGEIFVNVTSYELAYTRSPARMKGLVYSMSLFNTAIASAISLAMSNAIQDPYLIWPWVALACATFLCAILLKTSFRHLDAPVQDFANKDRQEGKHQPGLYAKEDTL